MKKLSFLLISGLMTLSSVRAGTHAGFLITENRVQSTLPDLLSLYYDVKNALFNSNASEAAAKAGLLLKAINSVDTTALSEKDHAAFMSLQSKLSFDARHISEVQKIDHQREHFASLSLNMYALAKAVHLSTKPVYEDYCPMKKAYWLSSDAEIKNPYYGNEMPGCGEIKNTIP